MNSKEKIAIASKEATTKAIIVTIIAIAWLFFIDPTDLFPVIGWIDDGGLLYCAYKCILTAIKHKRLLKETYNRIENNVNKVDDTLHSIKNNKSRKNVVDNPEKYQINKLNQF